MKKIATEMKFEKTTGTILFLLCALANHVAVAQGNGMDSARQLKNTVRLNLSGMILFSGGYFVLGYERMVKPNQSFSVNLGLAKMPRFGVLETDSFKIKNDVKNAGYNVSVDYRFYLAKENKFPAPHGMYFGPYYSFNWFHRTNSWDYLSGTGTVSTDARFTVHTIGVELGYQFVLKKHFAIDLVMIGPGLGFYSFNSDIQSTSNIDPATKQQLYDALQQAIIDKLPGMKLAVDNQRSNNGSYRTTAAGFRYLIQIGYRF